MDKSNAPKGQDNTPDHTNDSQNSGTLGNAPPRVGSDPPSPPEHSNPDRNSGQPPWGRQLPIWTFIGEIVLVAITLRIACIYSGQLDQMIENNRISQAALYSVQRPFIAAQKLSSELATYADSDKTGKPITVVETTAHWENVGNTPAIEVRTLFGSVEQRDELTEDEFMGIGLVNTPLTASALAPKVVFDSHTLRQREEWFLEKSDPDSHWFYWGWMVYKDIFPNTKTHVTESCWRIDEIRWKIGENGKRTGKPNFSGGTCRLHNCVDEFCEDYSTIIRTAQSK